MLDIIAKPAGKKANPNAIKTEIITIGPELARAFMEKNTLNRPLSEYTVRRFMRDMDADQWQLTGDAIRFDRTGRLLDGQHRLTACVRSGASFQSIVIYGLEPESQTVIDTGKARGIPDMLALGGTTNTMRVTSALRALMAYKAGFRTSRAMAITHTDVLKTFERHRLITRSVPKLYKPPRYAPVAALVFLHYAATQFLDAGDRADAMANVWLTGVPDYPGDPMHMLRDRLLRQADAATAIRSEEVAQTLYGTWNKFRVRQPAVHFIRTRTNIVDIDGLDRDLL